MFANQRWFFLNHCYSYLLHLGLSWTLFYLTRYSEALAQRKKDTEKELKRRNQSQPTNECNNVKSDRNRYGISTYPPSRMLERKDNWVAAGGLTWKSNQIIEGKRAETDSVCMSYQGEIEVMEKNTSLYLFSDHYGNTWDKEKKMTIKEKLSNPLLLLQLENSEKNVPLWLVLELFC